MYAVSVSLEVNPAGSNPALTREKLWRGLEIKAEDPVPFVPGMESCQVVHRMDDGFVREVVVRGQTFSEALTFTPPVQIRFDRTVGEDSGWIMNTISEGPSGLLLTYTIAMNFPGVWPGTEEEKTKGDEMQAEYVRALKQTLEILRGMVVEGKL